MPIEVEDKFVLTNNPDIEKQLMSELKKYRTTVYEIQQAYIGLEGRIRKRIKIYSRGRKLEIPITEYFFTYKRKLKKSKGSLELEMKMTKIDFDLAWEEEKTVSLTKTRICLHTSTHEMWEIDFFKANHETYFILAECELPSDKHKPKNMPSIVKDNLLYIVPDNDPRFKNSQLSDPDKVRLLLHNITMEHVHDKTISDDAPIPLQSPFSRKHRRNVF